MRTWTAFSLAAVLALLAAAIGAAGLRADDAPPAAAAETEKPQEPAPPPIPAEKVYDLPPTAGIEWIGAPADLDALYGQPVVLAFVETWCPICNGWAPGYARQVKEVADKLGATLIYVGMDVSKAQFESYLKKYSIEYHAAGVAPKALGREFGFKETLWTVVAINARGERTHAGQYGMFYTSDKSKSALALELPRYFGETKPLVEPGEDANLKKADLAARLGLYDAALKLAAKGGDPGTQARDRLLARGREVFQAARSYESADAYLSWRLARLAAREFKGQDFAKEAAALEARLAGAPAVRQGKAGDAALAKLMDLCKQSRADDAAAIDMWGQIVEKCRETRAGRVAMRALGQPSDRERAPAGK
jgi:hypothetical protein